MPPAGFEPKFPGLLLKSKHSGYFRFQFIGRLLPQPFQALPEKPAYITRICCVWPGCTMGALKPTHVIMCVRSRWARPEFQGNAGSVSSLLLHGRVSWTRDRVALAHELCHISCAEAHDISASPLSRRDADIEKAVFEPVIFRTSSGRLLQTADIHQQVLTTGLRAHPLCIFLIFNINKE